MSEKIKVPKLLADFYESFIDNYYMSQITAKLEEKCKLPRMFSSRDKKIKDELLEYIKVNGLESTIETLWFMHLNGYEVKDEVQKYKIVVSEENDNFYKGREFVFWNVVGEWLIRPVDFFIECEGYKKSFTMEEIIKNFPALVDNAVKVN